ncbi:MAG: ROK family transcriptional regulator [Propionicimonas sp.]|uniref:ROK family transcriptional regulator n=1 Tax=Propionicimonas sp. TaxID=1955623 RepID=UPI002B1FDC6B|nr:ROK family transcriptional regulator [Propionicimonas sp.]MEA4945114.1 ROK family transcriptional regulator [Propionicimonas sp.]MEA5052585.1 ROK family transcriptional regulator [Propionicimonas sp.]MEA5119407.1 ROK family transcriptional regulator [Propionicimonas sp.]
MQRSGAPSSHRHRRSGPHTTRPEDGRRTNLSLVLQSLYDEPQLSRADLARRTGLTRVTISDLVAELIADNLVIETGTTAGVRPGKPATTLSVREDTRDVVALDLSAPDTISGGIYSLRGEPRLRLQHALDFATGETAYAAVADLARELVAQCTRPVLGVGVGTPGAVDSHGTVVAAPNLAWYNLPLQQQLADDLGLPVHVENDANIAALAERLFADGPDNLIRLQISRGVGAGLLIAGSVVVGTSAAAGEIGHVVVDYGGEPCPCGKNGCLETWLSVPSLRRRMAAAPDEPDEVLAEAGRRLGIALSPVVGMLDLNDIVLGGPAELVNGPLLAAAQQVVTERTHSDFRGEVGLHPSSLGPDAVLLGAVALVLRIQLGVS